MSLPSASAMTTCRPSPARTLFHVTYYTILMCTYKNIIL